MIKQCLILFISNIILWIQRIGARAYTNRGESLVGSPLDQTKFNIPLGEFGKAWKTRYENSGSIFN